MNWKMLGIGFAIGAVAGYMRIKSSPTAHTQNAKGF
jgi:hypothetical protein